jgi:hypothetical protein
LTFIAATWADAEWPLMAYRVILRRYRIQALSGTAGIDQAAPIDLDL